MRDTITVRNRHDDLTLAGYYSNTYDALVIEGDDDDTHIVVTARFDKRDDAIAFAEKNSDVFAVRPPAKTVDDAVTWLHCVTMCHTEGYKIKRPRY